MAATGPGVLRGTHPGAAVWAIAPAVLSALGIPVPGHMAPDRIPWLEPALHAVPAAMATGAATEPSVPVHAASVAGRDGDREADIGESAEGEIAEHLRMLGYLE